MLHLLMPQPGSAQPRSTARGAHGLNGPEAGMEGEQEICEPSTKWGRAA